MRYGDYCAQLLTQGFAKSRTDFPGGRSFSKRLTPPVTAAAFCNFRFADGGVSRRRGSRLARYS
jgi:hypothetical protein